MPRGPSGAGVSDVDTVIVDGVIRKRDGKLVGLDLARARGLAGALAAKQAAESAG